MIGQILSICKRYESTRVLAIDKFSIRHSRYSQRRRKVGRPTGEANERVKLMTFLSDGGDTVRQTQSGARLHGEWVLNWFHIGKRFQHLVQLAKGLTDSEHGQTAENFIKNLLGAKWHLWHGCAYRALQRLELLSWDIECFDESESKKKLAAKLDEALAYFDKNQGFIVNYGDRPSR